MKKIFLTVVGLAAAMGMAGLPAWVGAHEGEEGAVQQTAQIEAFAPRDAASGLPTGKRISNDSYDPNDTNDPVSAPRDVASGQASGKRIRVESDGWGVTISASRVQDFEKNTEKIVEADENISRAEVTPEKVEIAYKRPVKLFGFLPMTMNLRAVVDKDGNLKMHKPWYSFLTTSEVDAFSAAVEADFKAQQDNLKTFKIQDLLQRQAQYFQSLTNILKTRHDTVKNSIGNIR